MNVPDPLHDVVSVRARTQALPAPPDGWVTVRADATRQVYADREVVDGCRASIVVHAARMDPPPDPRAVAARLLVAATASEAGTQVVHRSFGDLHGRRIAFQVLDVAGTRQIGAAWTAGDGCTVVASATCAPSDEDRVGAALLAVVGTARP